MEDLKNASHAIKNLEPLKFHLELPNEEAKPTITKIILNNKQLCSSTPERAQKNTNVALQYKLRNIHESIGKLL